MPNIPRHALIERPAQYAAIATMANFFSEIKSRMPTQSVTLAVEMRTRVLLTPRWVKEMASTGVRPVLSLHPSMPSIMRQTDMLRLLMLRVLMSDLGRPPETLLFAGRLRPAERIRDSSAIGRPLTGFNRKTLSLEKASCGC